MRLWIVSACLSDKYTDLELEPALPVEPSRSAQVGKRDLDVAARLQHQLGGLTEALHHVHVGAVGDEDGLETGLELACADGVLAQLDHAGVDDAFARYGVRKKGRMDGGTTGRRKEASKERRRRRERREEGEQARSSYII